MSKFWNHDDLALLKELWLDGVSASKIAARMGRTRNSILGIVHRAKDLPKRTTTIARSCAQRGFPPPRKPVVDPGKIIPRDKLKPAEPPIYTRDLEPHHCRFPYDDPKAPDRGGLRYCGLARSGASQYCDSHNRIVYRQAAPKDLDNAG